MAKKAVSAAQKKSSKGYAKGARTAGQIKDVKAAARGERKALAKMGGVSDG